MDNSKKIHDIKLNIFQDIFNWFVDANLSDTDKDYSKILNIYNVLLFLIFLLHSIFCYLFEGPDCNCIFLGVFSFLMLSLIKLNEKRKNEYFISFLLAFLSCIVTYYSLHFGLHSGVYIFYFSLLSCVFVVFSVKKQKPFVIFLVLFILFCLFISVTFDFKLVFFIKKINYEKELFRINLILNIATLIISYFIIERKKNIYYECLLVNQDYVNEIHSLNEMIAKFKKVSSSRKFTEENLIELLSLTHVSKTLFIDKFEYYFPQFYENLKKHTKDNLTHEELLLSGLIKLGLSTKEIARSTQSSVKSIESRKYRLRKKLDILSGEELTFWISNI